MARGTIYVLDEGRQDLSRWLRTSLKGDDCTLMLTDLCIAGRISTLRQVTLPKEAVMDVANGGDTQMNLGGGFIALNSNGDKVRIEFRGEGDSHATTAELPAAELKAALTEA